MFSILDVSWILSQSVYKCVGATGFATARWSPGTMPTPTRTLEARKSLEVPLCTEDDGQSQPVFTSEPKGMPLAPSGAVPVTNLVQKRCAMSQEWPKASYLSPAL